MPNYGTLGTDLITSSTGQTFSPASSSATMKNRIINGGMVIDQRNAGASVTAPLSNSTFSVDRWNVPCSQASKFTIQQNAGSVTPPVGFTNYVGVTSSSAYSLVSSDYFLLRQAIEGFNCADLGWGTANAKTVTLSFWVYSSLTGTFGGSIQNANVSRSYPFSYTISSANTWEQKSITIAGDTTGTWLTNNGNGMYVTFGLGVASNLSGTAGAWVGSNTFAPTGATSVVGTSGATFYITGVQLEVGSTASSFDYRPYGTELALCQRYYQQIGGGGYVGIGSGINNGGTYSVAVTVNYVSSMRTSPTAAIVGSLIATNRVSYDAAVTGIAETKTGLQSAQMQFTHATAGTDRYPEQICAVSGGTGFLTFTAEL